MPRVLLHHDPPCLAIIMTAFAWGPDTAPLELLQKLYPAGLPTFPAQRPSVSPQAMPCPSRQYSSLLLSVGDPQ